MDLSPGPAHLTLPSPHAVTAAAGASWRGLRRRIAAETRVTIKPTGVETPQRGSSMSAVEARFGAPSNKSGPVGTPPITKWFYPNFVVVFEHDKVLHAVVVGS